MGFAYLCLSLLGFFDATEHALYYLVCIWTGISNAFLLPCFISINGNWFPMKKRGTIVGMWQSCNNIGNIVGGHVAAALLDGVHGKW